MLGIAAATHFNPPALYMHESHPFQQKDTLFTSVQARLQEFIHAHVLGPTAPHLLTQYKSNLKLSSELLKQP